MNVILGQDGEQLEEGEGIVAVGDGRVTSLLKAQDGTSRSRAEDVGSYVCRDAHFLCAGPA